MSGEIKVGVVCVLKKDGGILMGLRSNVVGDGYWGLPGGHLEFGEKLDEAAKRELLEETGVKALVLIFTGLVNDRRDDVHYIHLVFSVTQWEGEARNMEPNKCKGWEWHDLNSLPANIFHGHAGIIESIKNNTFYYEQPKK
jgi:8-oxo-dGTP diphosphatase